MKLHGNARTCPHSRRLLVERVELGWTLREAAGAAGVSERTASKWLARWRCEGERGLLDRSSRPHRQPRRTPSDRVAAIVHLRRLRMTAAEIAEVLRMALSTVSLILKRVGLGKRSRLEPLEPVNRYERERPGELVHLDIKPLARFDRAGHKLLGRGRGRFETGAGYEYVYVAVDDYSRVAHAELLPDERAATAARFLRTTAARFGIHGVTIERVLTDNGSAFLGGSFRDACAELAIKHSRTRPRRPQTNGKAERFIQTLLREWAYARLYATSHERAQTLPLWLNHYNYRRQHGSLSHQPPATRLNNVSSNYN
jgi:transposase InsO family protein